MQEPSKTSPSVNREELPLEAEPCNMDTKQKLSGIDLLFWWGIQHPKQLSL
jgi:hypothetical protein